MKRVIDLGYAKFTPWDGVEAELQVPSMIARFNKVASATAPCALTKHTRRQVLLYSEVFYTIRWFVLPKYEVDKPDDKDYKHSKARMSWPWTATDENKVNSHECVGPTGLSTNLMATKS